VADRLLLESGAPDGLLLEDGTGVILLEVAAAPDFPVVEETVTGSVTTGTPVTTGSWTPGANELILVGVAMRATGITPTCSGNGLNFVVVQDQISTQTQNRIVVFRAMGASPSTGAITVTVTGNTQPVGVIATRFSNVDTSGTDGSGACEASTETGGPGTDDNDMLLAVTTVTANALAWGFGSYRAGLFTVPGGQTIIHDDLAPGGTGGEEANSSSWYAGPVVTPASTTVGAADDLNSARDWSMIAISIKPATTDVVPAALDLGLALPGPSLRLSLAPGALSLGLAQGTPALVISVAPAALSLGLAQPGPALLLQIAPGALDLGLALGSPNVGGVAVQVDPDPLDLGLGLPSPTLLLRVDVGALSLGLAQPTPAVVLSVSPGALSLGLAQVDPTLTVAPFQISPAALDLGLAILSPTLTLAAPPVAGLPSVQYVIEILNSGGTFGPNALLGEVWDARNLGWSRFDRIPGKAFFTLNQRSALLPLLVPLTTHFRIVRLTPTATTVVWAGIVADWDSTGDDVIVFGYDYLSLLSVSRAGYKTLYPTKKLGTEIVSPEWTLAENATTSPPGFVTTGTIQDPPGTDGATTIKTNAQFGTLDQMRLQLFYDLSEMGRANTINYVTYEITKDTPHTFNFWKNKGSTWAGAFVLNGNVREYRYLPNWIGYRNDFASVAMAAAGGPAEIVQKDDTAAAAKGRRQDVFTARTLLGISGAATEADQQAAALAHQLKRGLQLQPALQLDLLRGAYTPGVLGLCDRVPVEISNGADSITGSWVFLGETCIVDESGESPTVLVRPVAV
jgi:hypothetical protein